MRRSGGAVVLVVIGLACSPIKTAHAPADAPAPTPGAETASGTEATWIDVANAEVAQVGAGRRLTLALTRTPEAVGEREMSSPPRLVLDLAGPRAAAPPATPGAPEAPDTVLLMVRDVRVEPMGADRRLIIELTRPPDDVRDFALSAPPRLVMDLHGPLPTKPAVLTRFPLTDDVIAGVRVATNGGALRIVADL